VILLRVLLHEYFHIKPELIDFDAQQHHANGRKGTVWPEAMLVIGDKVVTEPTPAIRYPYQLDLGQQWKDHTGMPFVFAAWLAKAKTDVTTLNAILDRQRRYNRHTIDRTIASRAVLLGWPVDLARLYVNEMLRYEWTEPMKQSVARFFESAHAMGLIDRAAPLVFSSS
jgi:chorismate dehydratase